MRVRPFSWRAVSLAWLLGAGLTALLHGVLFGPPGPGWWFGLASGAWEGGAGAWMNRRALRGREPREIGWALGGGLIRMAVSLLVWRMGSGWIWPEYASAACLLGMHVVMMSMGIREVVRVTR